MKNLLCVVFIGLLLTSPLWAQETKRLHLATQLAEVLGLENMLMEIKEQTQQSADQQFSQMMEQFKKSSFNVPPQFMAEIGEAGAEFTRKVSSGWDTVEAARIYSSALADVLPEDDLRESIEHYRSPEGQDQLKAISAASAKLNAYIVNSIQKASQEATQEFTYKLQLIVQKAKRDREAAKDSQD